MHRLCIQRDQACTCLTYLTPNHSFYTSKQCKSFPNSRPVISKASYLSPIPCQPSGALWKGNEQYRLKQNMPVLHYLHQGFSKVLSQGPFNCKIYSMDPISKNLFYKQLITIQILGSFKYVQ